MDVRSIPAAAFLVTLGLRGSLAGEAVVSVDLSKPGPRISADLVTMANWAQAVNVIGAIKTSRTGAVLDPLKLGTDTYFCAREAP